MPRSELTPQNGDNPAVLALTAHPLLILLDGDRCEPDFHTHIVGFEKQVLHNLARHIGGGAEKYAQRKSVMDVGLTDIENHCIIVRKNRSQRSRHTGFILPGYINENQLYIVVIGAHLPVILTSHGFSARAESQDCCPKDC